MVVSNSKTANSSKSLDFTRTIVLTCLKSLRTAATRSFQIASIFSPSSFGLHSLTSLSPNEYTGEFLPEISRTFEAEGGLEFLTVFAPQAVCSNTMSSNPTLEGFHFAPTRRANISSQSGPSSLGVPREASR